MTERRLVGELEKLSLGGKRLAHMLDERTHGWLGVFANGIMQTLRPFSTVSAAAISYFAFFSIFPILLLTISLASFNLSPLIGWHHIIMLFEFIAPALDQLLGQNIASIIHARGPITGVALVTLVWSGSAIFYTLSHTLNEIWGSRRLSAAWRRRALAIVVVLGVIGPVLFLASITGSLIDNLRAWLPDQLLFFGKGISFLVAFLLDVVLLFVLYLLLPHGRATWREIIPGATGAGFLWELAKKGFLLFVSTYVNATNLVYGSVAVIVAFLTWGYLSGLIFMFGANISLAYYHLRQSKLESGDKR